MTIEQVFSRQGKATFNGLYRKKRIIAAIDRMNGNFKKALVNLSNWSKVPKIGTLKAYWSEFNKLSASEQKRFLNTSASVLLIGINRYTQRKLDK